MNPLKALLKIFNLDINDVEEELMTIGLRKEIKLDQFPKLQEINQVLSMFPYRDHLTINLLDNSETLHVVNETLVIDESEYNRFIKENKELENEVIISINITKRIEDEKVSVYILKSFIDMIQNKKITEIMKIFSNILEKYNKISFVNYDDLSNFYTKTISMINSEKKFDKKGYDRNENLEKIKSIGNFINNVEYRLLPEDFDIEYSSIDTIVKEKFSKIRTILSIIYISNISKIENEKLDVHLSGYQNKDFQIDLENLVNRDNYEDIYEIYKWTYKEGNISDKINLVRNVISLHCKYSGILEIDNKTFASIKSNYEIYLKKNLDKYIELKNKATEFTMQTYTQINDISLDFISSLKKNIIAFVTFLLGTILTNVVSDSKLDNILTNDIVAICYWLLAGSIVYLVISIFELNFKFNRYTNSYFQLKNSYKDLLDDDDIEEIFEKDKGYIENKELISEIKIKYAILWTIFIIGTGIAIAIFKNIDVISKMQMIMKNIQAIINIFN